MLSLPLSAELVPLRLFYGKWGILVFCSSGLAGEGADERKDPVFRFGYMDS